MSCHMLNPGAQTYREHWLINGQPWVTTSVVILIPVKKGLVVQLQGLQLGDHVQLLETLG